MRFVPTLATIDGVKISAVIIAFNEEENIAKAVESVSWADEVVVVDSESTDRTRDIAEGLGARVLIRKWTGFSDQKQFAVDQAANDWIFSLDADERVSPELKDEILRLDLEQADGFRIPRLSFYMGRAIRHSGWYPDRQLRFFNRTKGRWKKVHIHESVEMKSGTRLSQLENDIHHFSVNNASHHHRMIGERYAPLAAEQMFENGKRTSSFKIAIAGPAAFFRAYFLKLGFMDGLPGFSIASFAAHHAFLKHLLLWEKQTRKNRPN
ncbi:MAG: glycosyltransferase family 2 protein [Acidobacteria bacterium]|nr:glycosyltransferase family 2 protein [Acidobacteriota bacterium]